MNALFYIDFYKQDHVRQYPADTEQVWSNWTARSSRIPGQAHVVFFGLQYFVKEILQRQFNVFFCTPLECILKEYREVMQATLGVADPKTDHIEYLHKLGHLPIRIYALPEGTKVPIGVPMLVITNTDPRCYWLPNYLETVMSAHLWKPSTSATTASRFRALFEKYATEFGEKDLSFVPWQGHDFSYRGMSGNQDAIMSGMGHLLSFSGTDTVPAILAARKYYNAPLNCGGSVPACYDDQTEILTPVGFIPFCELTEHDLVAQYTDEDMIEFVKPEKRFVCPYKGAMVSFTKTGYRYVDALVTPNHRMVKRTNFDGKLKFFAAEEGNYSHRSTIVVAGAAAAQGPSMSMLDRLRIAFQADGSFPVRRHKYTGERSGTIPIRFSLKKQRKADRLDFILAELGFVYTKELYSNGYYSYWVKIPRDIPMQKDLDWVDLNTLTASRARAIVQEFTHWDGKVSSLNTLSYHTTERRCADMAQAIGILAGYKTQFEEFEDQRQDFERKTCFTVIFTLNKSEVSGEDVVKSEVPYDGNVYCVKVPSGRVVTRRNGVVLISGNTEHSVMCAGGQDGEFETFKRLITEIYPTGIVSIVSDTWDLWRVLTDYIPRLRETILAREGKLVIRPDSGDPVKIMLGDPDASGPARIGALSLLASAMGTDGKGHINKAGLIYGDGISIARADAILTGCIKLGLSPFNVVFGIGSYTYEHVTRDEYNFAMKATAIKRSGKLLDIFKKPVTDNFSKTSLVGLPVVQRKDNLFYVHDRGTPAEFASSTLGKRIVFEDSDLLIEDNFLDIKERLRTDSVQGTVWLTDSVPSGATKTAHAIEV